MRPVIGEFQLTLNGDPVLRIRPSLRAAWRLQEKHTLGALYEGILFGNATIIGDIIEAGSGDLMAVALYHDVLSRYGVKVLGEIGTELFNFLAASFGLSESSVVEKGGTPQEIADVLTTYFEIATGWLGWTPSDAWASTPSEIVVAQHGLVAKLRAIHGSSDAPENDASAKGYTPPVFDAAGRDTTYQPSKVAAFAAKHGRVA